MSEIVKQLTEGLNELAQERQKLIDERDNLIKGIRKAIPYQWCSRPSRNLQAGYILYATMHT